MNQQEIDELKRLAQAVIAVAPFPPDLDGKLWRALGDSVLTGIRDEAQAYILALWPERILAILAECQEMQEKVEKFRSEMLRQADLVVLVSTMVDDMTEERDKLRERIEKLKVAGRNPYTQSAYGYDLHIPELGGTVRQEFALEILRQVLEEVPDADS